MSITRRQFVQASAAAAALAPLASCAGDKKPGDGMQLGLVTYLWGADWDLPTLLANCKQAGVKGVELRTTHKHGVEPKLNAEERRAVRARFADSPVTLAGIGSNERFDNPDPAVVQKAIEASKAYIKLSHDVGSSGVKVKPDRFHPNVPQEKTIQQIGESLNTLGKFAADYDQQVRLEVHGGCAELPVIDQILEVAQHPAVTICWNSNAQDLAGKGLEYNFNLVKDRLGDICHTRELDHPGYPWQQLIDLLVGIDYAGWIALECSTKPADRVAAMAKQVELLEKMIADAQSRV